MEYNALVLAPWMAPHKIFSWHRAVSTALAGDVDVLEEYDETVSAPSITMRLPAVLRVRKEFSKNKNEPRFSRISVYQRDGFRCQYCGTKREPRQLTFDHVTPRHQGGKTTWTNIVAACGGPRGCNARKGNRTPAQAGMHLITQPTKPKTLPLPPFVVPKRVPDLWLPYLDGHRTIQLVVG